MSVQANMIKLFFPGIIVSVLVILSDQENSNYDFICGTKGQALISGGASSNKFDSPWKVAIFIRNGDDFKYSCGGSLVNNDTVVTGTKQKNLNCFIINILSNYFNKRLIVFKIKVNDI